MPYDLFISYSRRDNERGQVAALKTQIESSFRAFVGRVRELTELRSALNKNR